MKLPAFGILGFGGVVAAAVLLIVIGAPSGHAPPPPAATSSPEPSSVAARGFTLASAGIALPEDAGAYPTGPHADTINANCTACHSASMALTQPPMSADQWQTEVTKMREVYHAPVAAADVPAIVDYLVHLPSQRASGPAGQAQDPDPKAMPKVSRSAG